MDPNNDVGRNRNTFRIYVFVMAFVMGAFCALVGNMEIVDMYGNQKYGWDIAALIWGVLWLIFG